MTKGGQQSEMVLETRHLLGVFFSIAILCGVFFALGYVVGKNTFSSDVSPAEEPAVVVAGDKPSPKPSPMPPATYFNRPEEETPWSGSTIAGDESLSFYESAEAPPATEQSSITGAEIPPEVTVPPAAHILVQVSSLSQKENADALVQLLKQRNLPGFVTSDTKDQFFRVMIGPFHDDKEAEKVRNDLEGDGFRPFILR